MVYLTPTPEYDIIHELGICGCAKPYAAYEEVHKMLKRVIDPGRSAYPPTEWIVPECEYEGYVLFMAYILNDKGFLDHGTSIYGSWLTNKGKLLLKALDEFEKYDYEWDNVINADTPNMFYVEKGEKDGV